MSNNKTPSWLKPEALARGMSYSTVYDRYLRMVEAKESIDKAKLFAAPYKPFEFLGKTWKQWSEAIQETYDIKMEPNVLSAYYKRQKRAGKSDEWILEKLDARCRTDRNNRIAG